VYFKLKSFPDESIHASGFNSEEFRVLSMKMEQTEHSETLAYKIQTPGNCPEENMQHSEHGENLKSRIAVTYFKAPFQYLFTVTNAKRKKEKSNQDSYSGV